MNWMLVLVLAIACVTCASLGLTAGINLNPASTVAYVWDWSAAGGWVSGIGTLLAVIVTLWQVRRQQEREKPSVKAQQDFELEANSLSVALVSTGLVPSTILGAHLYYNGGGTRIDLSHHCPLSTVYPQRLDRGEVMSLLSLKDANFYMLGRSIVDPLVDALEAKGERPAVHGAGLNQKFFDELNSVSSRGATLIVKTAYGVEEFPFSQDALCVLLKYAIEDELILAKQQLESWSREDRKLAKILADELQRPERNEDKSE